MNKCSEAVHGKTVKKQYYDVHGIYNKVSQEVTEKCHLGKNYSFQNYNQVTKFNEQYLLKVHDSIFK